MEDDFLEEDTIFGDDEVLDCIICEETETGSNKKQNNAGCLNTLLVMLTTFSSFATLVFWIAG